MEEEKTRAHYQARLVFNVSHELKTPLNSILPGIFITKRILTKMMKKRFSEEINSELKKLVR